MFISSFLVTLVVKRFNKLIGDKVRYSQYICMSHKTCNQILAEDFQRCKISQRHCICFRINLHGLCKQHAPSNYWPHILHYVSCLFVLLYMSRNLRNIDLVCQLPPGMTFLHQNQQPSYIAL